VVRILDRMERGKLITRARNKADRRAFNFLLTDKARKVCRHLEEHANAMHAIATVNIPSKEIEKFNIQISAIIGNLQDFLEKK